MTILGSIPAIFHCRLFKSMQQKISGEILVARNFTVFLYWQLDPLSFNLNTSERLYTAVTLMGAN